MTMSFNSNNPPQDPNQPRKKRPRNPKPEVALPDRLAYNRREAAEFIGVSERTIWTLVNRGDLKSIKVGSRVLIPRKAMEDFLNGGIDAYGGRN
jgi:excisionase family DNA binding protein